MTIFYDVDVMIDGKYYDTLDSFSCDENTNEAKRQAEEYADAYNGDDEWFNDFTDYEFEDSDWIVVVSEGQY